MSAGKPSCYVSVITDLQEAVRVKKNCNGGHLKISNC